MRERQAEYRASRDLQFAYKSITEITKSLRDSGEIVSSSDKSIEDEISELAILEPADPEPADPEPADPEEISKPAAKETNDQSKNKRKFEVAIEAEDDSIPVEYRHIRKSQRLVKDEFYKAQASLTGAGLSSDEATKAIIIVGNKMFNRNWKAHDESEVIDINTVPNKRNIREANKLIEAHSLSLVVDELQARKEEGRMVTHAMDSTTKKGVGQFAVAGIHIGQESCFPLPVLPIHGETTEDIAMQVVPLYSFNSFKSFLLQVDMGFEVLAAVRGVPVKEVYSLVDAHMTDSVQHNKGFTDILQELYSLEKPAGQLFCGTHTTLGFSSAMNKKLRQLEADMKMDQVLNGFMVDLEMDTKNASLAGQAIDICLKLVAPEYSHKPWNRHKEFLLFLQQRKASNVLFAYKDNRFGCLPRAAAVLLYIYQHLVDYLDQNPGVNNRLACLAREVLALSYLRPVLATLACLGVYLVEPFYARTIAKGATHSQLKKFYKVIYNGMGSDVTEEDYIYFTKPHLEGVTNEMFEEIKKSYGEEVLEAVTAAASETKEEVIKLTNFMMPEMRKVLARQRRDYGIDEESFPAEYPVEDQASMVDDTPVHNIGMERQCGKVDYRLQKLKNLQAVSRSIILQRAEQLRTGASTSFRGFKEAVEAKKEIEIKWSEKTKESFKQGADEKRVLAQIMEGKRLDQLDKLKNLGGPFTDAAEVDEYLNQCQDMKAKKARMKLELRFARDSSTLLLKADSLFNVMVTMPSGKRRDKTPVEFGQALMAFLGKKGDRSTLDYSSFCESLEKLVST